MLLCVSYAAALPGFRGRTLSQAAATNSLTFPPLCKCDRDPSHSPYRLALTTPASRQYCFVVNNDKPCDPKEYCCKTDVGKIEINVGELL